MYENAIDLSLQTSSPLAQSQSAGRVHTFVKTSFSKTVACKLCVELIKRHSKAFLCEGCGLICHARCSEFASGLCDLRASLMDYSRGPTTFATAAESLTNLSSSLPASASPLALSHSHSQFYKRPFKAMRSKTLPPPPAHPAEAISGLPRPGTLASPGFAQRRSSSTSSGSHMGSSGSSHSARMPPLSPATSPLAFSADTSAAPRQSSKLKRRESGGDCIIS